MPRCFSFRRGDNACGAFTARRTSRVAALCGLVSALLLMTACGEKAVTSVQTESDAIEILDVLGQSGLDADKRAIGEGETRRWEIVLDEGVFGGGQAALAVQVMRDHGLPRPEEPVSEDSGLIPSERAEKIREQRRIRTDIERQLRALPGVTLALVTVVLPQDPTLELNPYPATASVVINYQNQTPAFTEQQVQNLVAKGVPNLKPQDVSVTMSPQSLRPVPQSELSARRRNSILLAAGIGLVTLLCFFLALLMLQTRRQRAALAELREGGEDGAQKVETAKETAYLGGANEDAKPVSAAAESDGLQPGAQAGGL
jgi:type III secretion system YscJ/HrcJ family lipoprotein